MWGFYFYSLLYSFCFSKSSNEVKKCDLRTIYIIKLIRYVMKTRKVALIIFYDNKKRILLQDRKGISKIGEEWGYFGGGIEEGESPEETIIREVKEELDFDLENPKFIGIDKNQVNEEKIVERYTFIFPLENNFSKFNQIEGDNMQLFTLDEAKNLKMVPGDELVLERLTRIL